MTKATCEICGKEFEASSIKVKVCSDKCRKKVAHLQKIERLRLKMKAGKKLTILEINEMALAEHISYGQFVGKYGI